MEQSGTNSFHFVGKSVNYSQGLILLIVEYEEIDFVQISMGILIKRIERGTDSQIHQSPESIECSFCCLNPSKKKKTANGINFQYNIYFI